MPKTTDDWNPRYLAYCRAHGKSPDAMLEHDSEAWPGGVMCGFILWMHDRWRQFEVAHHAVLRSDLDRAMWRLLNTDAFDIWLQTGGDQR